MIYTLTFNPSLDYVLRLQNIQLGITNRSDSEQILFGGKGINVSAVLNNLGLESVCLGFIAGFTGKEIEKKLKEAGCTTDFISLPEGVSRVNVKLKAGSETEINSGGPYIAKESIQKLYQQLDKLCEGDILVLAGSIPDSVPDTVYYDIMSRMEEKEIKVIVDATRELLVRVLEKHPFLIKPNHHELGDIFHVIVKTKEEVIRYAKKLQEMGARNVLVSMAEKGAVFVSEDGSVLKSEAPKGKVINSVGAGDSMVAGFLAGYLEENDYEYAFKLGISAGSASTFSTELAQKKEVMALFKVL